MNKIDLFFAKHMRLTYCLMVAIIPAYIGFLCGKAAGTLNEAFQYSLIASVIWILFYIPKIKKYKEFNNQRQTRSSTND